MKIGLFDSGIGGVAILTAVVKALPHYDYEYYGDTKNLPYGEKSEAQIYELTKAGVAHLFARDCVIVILACNTASAETLRRLQDEWLPHAYPERRILGVIVPTVEAVLEAGVRRALLIATKRTVSSGKYHLELGKRQVLHTKIDAVATPELVPLIEAGQVADAAALVRKLMADRQAAGEEYDGLILGCTHYGLMAGELQAALGERVMIFNQMEIIPAKLTAYLAAYRELEGRLSRTQSRNIFLTEHRADYDTYLEAVLQGRLLAE